MNDGYIFFLIFWVFIHILFSSFSLLLLTCFNIIYAIDMVYYVVLIISMDWKFIYFFIEIQSIYRYIFMYWIYYIMQCYGNDICGLKIFLRNFIDVSSHIYVSLVLGQGLYFSITRCTEVYFIAWKAHFKTRYLKYIYYLIRFV